MARPSRCRRVCAEPTGIIGSVGATGSMDVDGVAAGWAEKILAAAEKKGTAAPKCRSHI